MAYLITKTLITAGLIVLISELAKQSDKLGALVAALPVVTLLTLLWLFVERQDEQKIANHAYYTFWYVVPTLPMFLAFPALLARLGFGGAMLAALGISVVSFLVWVQIARWFGVELLS